jgi:uncharacterized damage-inducible protein DinB
MSDVAAGDLVEALAISNRITLYLLEGVTDEGLAHVLAKGRGLAAQFAHIHNVRLMWLDSAKADHDSDKLATKGVAHPRGTLYDALVASGQALEAVVGDHLARGKRIPGFKPHTAGFVGYMIAHQGYHHGEIGMIAREIGQPIDRKHAMGMWEWGVR